MSATGLRILIADDEAPMRALLERALHRAGYELVIASDGAEAVALCRELGPFDLLITDVDMPGMRGVEVARLVHRHQPNINVLYLTAHPAEPFKYRPTLWQNERLLEKPVSLEVLLETVSTMIGSPWPATPSTEGVHEIVMDSSPPTWYRCPRCSAMAAVVVPTNDQARHFECTDCGHEWKEPRATPARPSRVPKRRTP